MTNITLGLLEATNNQGFMIFFGQPDFDKLNNSRSVFVDAPILEHGTDTKNHPLDFHHLLNKLRKPGFIKSDVP